jgi:hypothetical protein
MSKDVMHPRNQKRDNGPIKTEITELSAMPERQPGNRPKH